MSGVVGASVLRLIRFKIAQGATIKRLIDQCSSVKHISILKRQAVESLQDGHHFRMGKLSMICDYACKSVLNTLELM